jgi:hypothetical protein
MSKLPFWNHFSWRKLLKNNYSNSYGHSSFLSFFFFFFFFSVSRYIMYSFFLYSCYSIYSCDILPFSFFLFFVFEKNKFSRFCIRMKSASLKRAFLHHFLQASKSILVSFGHSRTERNSEEAYCRFLNPCVISRLIWMDRRFHDLIPTNMSPEDQNMIFT